MVPYKKWRFNEDCDVFSNIDYPYRHPSNITLQEETNGRMDHHNVIANNPLGEYAVFSDSEEEREYVERVYGILPMQVNSPQKKHKEIQCDLEILELSDILKVLSDYRFETAKRYEIEELVALSKFLELKYLTKKNGQLPTVISSLRLENGHLLQEAKISCSNECKISKDRNPIVNSTHLINAEENQEVNIDSVKTQQIMVGNVSITENIDENTDSGTEMATLPKKTRTSKKKKLLVGNKPKSVKNKQRQLSRKNKETTESKETYVESNEHDKGSSVNENPLDDNTKSLCLNDQQNKTKQSDATENIRQTFKRPLPASKSVGRNWMRSNKSLNLDVHEEEKMSRPIFTSFQSHLRMRRLHSPGEWLNSEAFTKSIKN